MSLRLLAPWLPPVIRQIKNFRAHGGAGDFGGSVGEEYGRGFKAQKDLGAPTAGQHIGPTRSGVGVVDEGLEAKSVAGKDRRQGSEATHADDRIRIGGLEDGLAAAD